MSKKLFLARSVLTNLAKSLSAPTAVLAQPKRFYSSDAKAETEEYGYHPDPFEHARGLDKQMILARSGDDGNTTKYHKEYDSDEFLKQAHAYLDQDPPDVLQSGEKMWGAVSYSLSCLFMSRGAKPMTHKIKSTLINLILESEYVKANEELCNVILNGWNSANLAHKNFYEVIDDYDTYKRWLKSVTAFCKALEKPNKRLISEVDIIIAALVSSKDARQVDARISSLSQRSLDFFRYEKMPPNTVEIRALKSYVIKYNFIQV
ncbi:hypothetical protein Ddc_01995 [Ditylenchus destructor]|nr:hypothetical protein Ddc_01995 [Ditylenchus destructor]